MKSKTCSCSLAYNFGKNRRKNEVMKIVCFLLSSQSVVGAYQEIRFAVRKFGKSR